jgi:hypothetical protein
LTKKWSERIRNVQVKLKNEGPRVLNQVLNYLWKRNPFLPWDIDCCVAKVIVLENCVNIERINQVWRDLDWNEFFDLIGMDMDEIEAEEHNRKKKLYGYPNHWSPDRIVSYWAMMGYYH